MTNGVDNNDGGMFHHPSKIIGFRPVFIEPLPRRVVMPRDGGHYQRGIIVSNDSSALRLRMSSSSSSASSFPIKDHAGYIGYLTDDDDDETGSGGGDAYDVMMKVLNLRRRQLMGSDMSFSGCLFLVIMVALLMAVVVAMMMFVK